MKIACMALENCKLKVSLTNDTVSFWHVVALLFRFPRNINGTPSYNGQYSVQHTIKIKKKKNNQCLNSSLFQLVIFYVECSLAGLAKKILELLIEQLLYLLHFCHRCTIIFWPKYQGLNNLNSATLWYSSIWGCSILYYF